MNTSSEKEVSAEGNFKNRMGLHKSVISRIERGKYHNDLSLATLLKIAEKLQIDPALFLTFNELEKQLWREPLMPEENDDEDEK